MRNTRRFRKYLKRRGDVHAEARNFGARWIAAFLKRGLQ